MDKEFSWNLPDLGAIQAQNKARRAQQFQQELGAAQQAQQDQMAEQARRARWMELENKFAGRTMNPNMKMAAMLTMAGQPALLQQLYMNDSSNGKEAQSEMDALESAMANDMFALAGADNATYDKLTSAIIPLYRSKFEDLLKKGAKSRMGATWDEGWGLHLSRGKETRSANKKNAADRKTRFMGKKAG